MMKIAEAREIAANPGAYSDEQLNLAKLKLFGRALKMFPSSPAQKAVQAMVEAIHNAQQARK